MKHVVVIGAGFGGLNAARALGASRRVEVTVYDRRNYHLFQPLLYQVAMAGLSPAEIAAPIRSLLAEFKRVECLLGSVTKIDPENRRLFGDFGECSYDYLIVAAGAQHSYFGHDEWEEVAPGLKTLEQAEEIRRRVLLAYELAEREENEELRNCRLTFVIVGGGPTGVELAGALGEIARHTLPTDFKHVNPRKTRVVLIEAGPRILPTFSEKTTEAALKQLLSLGVTVRTNARVTNVTKEGVTFGDEFLPSCTVIWAAGVKPSLLNQNLPGELDRQGRIKVNEYLQIPHRPEIYVIGDQAHFTASDGTPLPGLAPVAMQQGVHAAENILRSIAGKELKPYVYRDKGQMATVGRSRAVVEIKKVRFSGIFAWFVWLFVHIYYLIGFRNRLFVLFEWSWAYLTYTKSARLILSRNWKLEKL